MKTRNFLTVFPPFEAVHARKDVGSIPYYLSKECGWNSHLACFEAAGGGLSGIDRGDFREHVSLIDLGRRRGRVFTALRVLNLLRKRGKSFDAVNFYHDGLATQFYALLYKTVNRTGKTYIKLDMNYLDLEKALESGTRFLPRLARKMKYRLSRRAVDLYTVETKSFLERLSNDYYFRERLKYLPNGFSCETEVHRKDWSRLKENIILTVGRPGDPVKFNEVLIDAVAMLDPEIVKGWKVFLVGPVVSEHILLYAEATAEKHPHLADVFRFTGNVEDRDRLFGIYERSRIFCLTSRMESYAFVLLEAMFFGNYVISSDLPASRELTRNGTIGGLFPAGNARKLRDLLSNALTGKVDLATRAEESHRWLCAEYDWRNIAKELDLHLERRDTP